MPRWYTQEDLARVFQDANAKDWTDVLSYLESRPDRVGLNRDQVAAMEDDLENLYAHGQPFVADSAAIYRTLETK